LRPRLRSNIFSLHGLPLYNEDDDGEATRRNGCAPCVRAIETSDGVIMVSPEYNHGMSGVPEEFARLGLPALWTFGAEGQTGTDDDGLARLQPAGVRAAAANERDAGIDPGGSPVLRPQIVIGGVDEKVRDGRLVGRSHAALCAGGPSMTLLEEIRAAPRFVQAAA